MLDASKQSSQVKHIFQHQSMSKTANSPSISRSFFSSQVSSSKIRRAWILGCDAMEALHIDYMWCWVLHLGMCHKHLWMAVHWYGMYIFVYIQCSTPSTYNSLQIYRCLWFSTFLYMFFFIQIYKHSLVPNYTFWISQPCQANRTMYPGELSPGSGWRLVTQPEAMMWWEPLNGITDNNKTWHRMEIKWTILGYTVRRMFNIV